MPLIVPVDSIAHNIQLAVAPVFLLSGIGAILNVLSNRLGRVVDRARRVETDYPGYGAAARARADTELIVLSRRIASAHWAIGLCTLSALFVCVVVALLFVGDFIPMRGSVVVAALFIAAMVLLIVGLLLFLYEVQIATRSVHVRGAVLEDLNP